MFHPYGPTTLTADFLVLVFSASPWSMARRASAFFQAWHVLPRSLDIVISDTCLSERFEILSSRILPIYQYLTMYFEIYLLHCSNFSGQFCFSAFPKSVSRGHTSPIIPCKAGFSSRTDWKIFTNSSWHTLQSQVAKILTTGIHWPFLNACLLNTRPLVDPPFLGGGGDGYFQDFLV